MLAAADEPVEELPDEFDDEPDDAEADSLVPVDFVPESFVVLVPESLESKDFAAGASDVLEAERLSLR